jgi:hypothetical protein
MNLTHDYTPTKETISLHGLGFIQVKLPANRRLHVWHPDLPRRDCFAYSAIHNHRFGFRSTVLVGHQRNRAVPGGRARGRSSRARFPNVVRRARSPRGYPPDE